MVDPWEDIRVSVDTAAGWLALFVIGRERKKGGAVDVRQLRYFASVVRHQSLTKAAEALHLAQPALGLQIRKLEDELGVQLLMRHSRGVVPTEAGLHLVERATAILGELEATRQSVKNFSKSLGGRITLGMAPSIAAMLAQPLVQRVAQLHPEVTLAVFVELNPILAEWVEAERLDLAVGHELLSSPRLAGTRILEEELYLVRSNADHHIPTGDIPFSELAGIPLILPAASFAVRSLLDEIASAQGVELQVRFEMNSVELLREVAADGLGATVLTHGAVRRDCENGRLITNRIIAPVINRTAELAYSARRPRSRVELAVGALLRDIVEENQEKMGYRILRNSVSLEGNTAA